VRLLARRLYAYALLDDLVPLYPLYAVIFADHGLSGGQISSLFVLWSAVVFLLEIPSGAWADTFSPPDAAHGRTSTVGADSHCGRSCRRIRRSLPGSCCGLQSAMPGTLESLVYDELAGQGATARYRGWPAGPERSG
jgi:hypothetical protein